MGIWKKCFVPGCRSGLKGEQTNLSSFPFPKDPPKKLAWIKAIRRADKAPTVFSTVCEKHFDPNLIQRGPRKQRKFKLADGSSVTKEISYNKLDPEAIPTLLLDEPVGPQRRIGWHVTKRRAAEGEELPRFVLDSALTSAPPFPSRLEKPRRKKMKMESEAAIPDFAALLKLLSNPVEREFYPNLPLKWLKIIQNDPPGGILFYQFDPQSFIPTILRSVVIDSLLNAKAYYETFRIPDLFFQGDLRKPRIVQEFSPTGPLKITSWKTLLDILDKVDKYSGDSSVFDCQPKDFPRVEQYSRALQALSERREYLKTLRTSQPAALVGEDPKELTKINFIMEQISLLDSLPNQRSYSIPLHAWTEFIMRRSLEACRFLDQSGALSVPRMRLEGVNLPESQTKVKRLRRKIVPVQVTNEDSGDEEESGPEESGEESGNEDETAANNV